MDLGLGLTSILHPHRRASDQMIEYKGGNLSKFRIIWKVWLIESPSKCGLYEYLKKNYAFFRTANIIATISKDFYLNVNSKGLCDQNHSMTTYYCLLRDRSSLLLFANTGPCNLLFAFFECHIVIPKNISWPLHGNINVIVASVFLALSFISSMNFFTPPQPALRRFLSMCCFLVGANVVGEKKVEHPFGNHPFLAMKRQISLDPDKKIIQPLDFWIHIDLFLCGVSILNMQCGPRL